MPPTVDEHEVRAAAGLTMVIGAVAFVFAYFERQFVPLQIVTALFAARVPRPGDARAPVQPGRHRRAGADAGRPPEWVSAKPKRFAWTLGLAMTLSMTVVINSGVRGVLPVTVCLVCLTLMWLESVLGLCVGCEIAGLLMRRGWMRDDPGFEICAGGRATCRRG